MCAHLWVGQVSLDLRKNEIRGDAARQLSAAVVDSSIEVYNDIPMKELRTDELSALNLKDKSIGVDGVMLDVFSYSFAISVHD